MGLVGGDLFADGREIGGQLGSRSLPATQHFINTLGNCAPGV